MTEMLRGEYPRPQLVRADWLNLNGVWNFEFDDEAAGEREKWYEHPSFSRTIRVPFCYQSKLSGIGDPSFHDIVWYHRTFTVPTAYQGKRLILHFGAVDYECKVWVNGRLAAIHEGGHTPFDADITDLLQGADNSIVVKAVDYSRDAALPRGKQYWEETSAGIFYTRTTGIWQTVWIEPVHDLHIRRIRLTPDIDTNEVSLQAFVQGWDTRAKLHLKSVISFAGQVVSEDSFSVTGKDEMRRIRLHDFNDHGLGRWWSPERPNLYDLELTLLVDGEVVDTVASYFGMRKISIEDGVVLLNNRPYYMKMVLDQGYFPDGLLTAPSDEALKKTLS